MLGLGKLNVGGSHREALHGVNNAPLAEGRFSSALAGAGVVRKRRIGTARPGIGRLQNSKHAPEAIMRLLGLILVVFDQATAMRRQKQTFTAAFEIETRAFSKGFVVLSTILTDARLQILTMYLDRSFHSSRRCITRRIIWAAS